MYIPYIYARPRSSHIQYIPIVTYITVPKKKSAATIVFTTGQSFIGMIDVLAPVAAVSTAMTTNINADALKTTLDSLDGESVK